MTKERNRPAQRRIAGACAAVLVAGLLAACASVQAAQPVPVPTRAVTATRVVAAEPASEPTANLAADKTNETPVGRAAGPALPAETRSSEGGGVTIEATPEGAAGGELAFSLSLNTHMGDLSYNYQALASLRDDQGNVYPAAGWDGGNGGHHVKGKLLFSKNPLQSAAGVKWLELDLKDVAGVPLRTFRWNVG